MSGTAVIQNPMLASSPSVSIAAPAPSSRNAPTVLSLSRAVGQYTNNVPYPLLFVAGAALGILFASFIVLFTHSSKTQAERNVAAYAVAAPPVATWQPNVVVIHPAADPPMFETPYVADPPALNAPAQLQARPTANAKKSAVSRGQVRRQGKPANGNLLAAAL